MARYIDADKLKEAFSTDTQHLYTFDPSLYDLIVLDIDEAPTADVEEVKHGKWKIKRDDYDCEYMMCSVCKEEFYPFDADTVDTTPNYCPNCGAKMDGGEAE